MAFVTVEGVYKDGRVELEEKPAGLDEAVRVLVTFLPANGVERATEAGPKEHTQAREELRRQAFEQMERGVDLGGPPYPRREQLYDRAHVGCGAPVEG